MALLKRELHKLTRGSWANDEDWWYLVFDAETYRLYVEHKWSYVDVYNLNAVPDSGTAEMDIADFLGRRGQELKRGESQARAALAQLLLELVQGGSKA
jgi:hypothetical protein